MPFTCILSKFASASYYCSHTNERYARGQRSSPSYIVLVACKRFHSAKCVYTLYLKFLFLSILICLLFFRLCRSNSGFTIFFVMERERKRTRPSFLCFLCRSQFYVMLHSSVKVKIAPKFNLLIIAALVCLYACVSAFAVCQSNSGDTQRLAHVQHFVLSISLFIPFTLDYSLFILPYLLFHSLSSILSMCSFWCIRLELCQMCFGAPLYSQYELCFAKNRLNGENLLRLRTTTQLERSVQINILAFFGNKTEIARWNHVESGKVFAHSLLRQSVTSHSDVHLFFYRIDPVVFLRRTTSPLLILYSLLIFPISFNFMDFSNVPFIGNCLQFVHYFVLFVTASHVFCVNSERFLSIHFHFYLTELQFIWLKCACGVNRVVIHKSISTYSIWMEYDGRIKMTYVVFVCVCHRLMNVWCVTEHIISIHFNCRIIFFWVRSFKSFIDYFSYQFFLNIVFRYTAWNVCILKRAESLAAPVADVCQGFFVWYGRCFQPTM